MEVIRARKSDLKVELTPLVDVVFQLLVFFMLAASFAQPALRIILPRAVTTDEMSQESIVITVASTQDISLNGRPSSVINLKEDLQQILSRHTHKNISIKGDESIPYGFFIEVVDKARQAGAEQVNLIHEGSQP